MDQNFSSELSITFTMSVEVDLGESLVEDNVRVLAHSYLMYKIGEYIRTVHK